MYIGLMYVYFGIQHSNNSQYIDPVICIYTRL